MTEDSRNWKRYTRRGALGLMGVGAVGVASETLGFTNLMADRDTSLDVNDDVNSTLKIVNNDNQSTTIDQANFATSADIRFENTSSDGAIISLGSGDGSVTGNDSGSVTLSDGGGSVTVNTNTTNFNFASDLSGGDYAILTVNNDTSGGTDNTLSDLSVEGTFDFGGPTVSLSRDITIDP